MMFIHGAIAIGLAVFGLILGMDKSHSFRDWVGPILMSVGLGYAIFHSLTYVAIFIGLVLALKLIFR